MQNELFTEVIDTENKSQIDSFALFTDRDELSKQRSSAELGQMFGIDSAMLEQVYAMEGVSSMSIQEFLAAIQLPKIIQCFWKVFYIPAHSNSISSVFS